MPLVLLGEGYGLTPEWPSHATPPDPQQWRAHLEALCPTPSKWKMRSI